MGQLYSTKEIKEQLRLYGHYSPLSFPYSKIVSSPDINKTQENLTGWPIWPSDLDTPVERNPWDMVRCLMRDLNLNRIQACGITGNLYAESLLQNGRLQNTPSGAKGAIKLDGLTGYGLAQWTFKERQTNLYDFAKSLNQRTTMPFSMWIEYQFLIWEFKEYGNFNLIIRDLKLKTNILDASTIILQRFEKPAGYNTQPKISERSRICQRIYDYLDIEESHSIEGLEKHYKMKDINYKPPTSTKLITSNDMPISTEESTPRTWDQNQNSYEQFPEVNAFGDKKAVFPEDSKTSITVDLMETNDEGKKIKYGTAFYLLYKETLTGKLYYTKSSNGSPEGTYIPSTKDTKVYFNQ